MSAFRRMFAPALVCLSLTTFSAAQVSDQLAAARVLGPHWRQISRSSGMIFSGTVLSVGAQPVGKGHSLPVVVTNFRVDRAIAGVQADEILTVREWAGAWDSHRALRSGQRLLIFLYPTSRLGLTSPIGGRAGVIALDSRGELAVSSLPADRQSTDDSGTSGAEARHEKSVLIAAVHRCATQKPPFAKCVIGPARTVTLQQIERAILNARRMK